KLPSDNAISERIIQKMRISALLHDCGHLPFSHTFENLYEGVNHEDFGKYIIKNSIINQILRKFKIDEKSIGELVIGHINVNDPDVKELTQLLPLLHSDADADRIDYLLRDAYFTGVPYGNVDMDRICNLITLHEGTICFLDKAQDALENFLFSRYQMYKVVYIHKTVVGYELLLHKLYNDYIKKYSNKIDLPFFLPDIELFKTPSNEWFNEIFYNLTEASFFKSIQILLKSNEIQNNDKENLIKLYSKITNRIPIKNCFRYDDLAERSDTEYCDKETVLFEDLKNYPEIVNHWSFLRHDPNKPLQIASPINKDIDDQQDPNQIRILSNQGEILFLQQRTNSVIKFLARHHRVLICYYHDNEDQQKNIKKLARMNIFNE
ncbi:MAG: HD domain-containing protein, partial [Promethearchaeota archaeon]